MLIVFFLVVVGICISSLCPPVCKGIVYPLLPIQEFLSSPQAITTATISATSLLRDDCRHQRTLQAARLYDASRWTVGRPSAAVTNVSRPGLSAGVAAAAGSWTTAVSAPSLSFPFPFPSPATSSDVS